MHKQDARIPRTKQLGTSRIRSKVLSTLQARQSSFRARVDFYSGEWQTLSGQTPCKNDPGKETFIRRRRCGECDVLADV